MKDPTGSDAGSVSAWRSSLSVARWRHQLLHLVGCSMDEADQKIDTLIHFCTTHAISPEHLIERCRHPPAASEGHTFYSKFVCNGDAKVIVQSFLIHNGINIFGELICLPTTEESTVREQGVQWNLR
jgi:hypothetical protein